MTPLTRHTHHVFQEQDHQDPKSNTFEVSQSPTGTVSCSSAQEFEIQIFIKQLTGCMLKKLL